MISKEEIRDGQQMLNKCWTLNDVINLINKGTTDRNIIATAYIHSIVFDSDSYLSIILSQINLLLTLGACIDKDIVLENIMGLKGSFDVEVRKYFYCPFCKTKTEIDKDSTEDEVYCKNCNSMFDESGFYIY